MLDLLHGDRFIFYFYAHHSLWGLTPMFSNTHTVTIRISYQQQVSVALPGILHTPCRNLISDCLCNPVHSYQMPQPPITLDNGFIHRFRFNNVRNRIREVTKAKKNNFLKNILSLNSLYHVTIAFFQPFPASIGL